MEKGYSLKTQHEQQNGVVHASYSELQLEELETIAAAIWLPLYRTFTDESGNRQIEVYDYIWKEMVATPLIGIGPNRNRGEGPWNRPHGTEPIWDIRAVIVWIRGYYNES